MQTTPALPLAPSSRTSSRTSSPSRQSRAGSPTSKLDIAHFEDVHLAHPPSVRRIRGTTTNYSPEPPSPHEDFAVQSDSYRGLTNSFLSKLPPLITRATNAAPLYTPESSLPSSGPSPPMNSLASFITSNTSGTTASKASTRARHTSRLSVIDSFFNGTSAPLNVGILPSTRSQSPEHEEYDIDLAYGMETIGTAYTRAPPRTRPSRSSTVQSTSSTAGVAGRIGGWFSSKTSPTPKTSGIAPEDPMLNLDINSALFPHGPADPLDPTSFNDLLMAAESVIATMQSAYKARCAELRDLRSEMTVKDDEVDEAETRARHLKMQLDGMAGQVAAQEHKANVLEQMLEQQRRESQVLRRQSSEQGSRRVSLRIVHGEDGQQDARNWKKTRSGAGSDSGFESDGDGDSVFSTRSPTLNSESTVESETVPAEAEKVRLVRVERGRDQAQLSNLARAYAPIDLRIENRRLRERVVELEEAVEGCLDMVARL